MEILGFSLGILSAVIAILSVVLAVYLSKRTNILVSTEDARAKQLTDEGNKRLETILREMHEPQNESDKRWAERDKSWQEFFERMDRRSEQIDRTTKEILGKILEKVSG